MPSAVGRIAARSVVLAVLLALPVTSQAAIIGTCRIVINSAGTLKINPALNVLSSKQAGGLPAGATITASSLLCSLLAILDCYSVSAIAPASFLSAPAAGQTNLTFTSTFKLNGGADNPGSIPVRVVNGVYTTQVDLIATKSAGIFPTGTYQAQVLVRCE